MTVIHHISFREDSWYGSAGCSENFQYAGHIWSQRNLPRRRRPHLDCRPSGRSKEAMDAKAKERSSRIPPTIWAATSSTTWWIS
jgi:hypothetical protein